MPLDKTYLLRVEEGQRRRYARAAHAAELQLAVWMREVLDREADTVLAAKGVAPRPDPLPERVEVVRVAEVRSPVMREPVHARESARRFAVGREGCSADVARGTRCKLCGKVH